MVPIALTFILVLSLLCYCLPSSHVLCCAVCACDVGERFSRLANLLTTSIEQDVLWQYSCGSYANDFTVAAAATRRSLFSRVDEVNKQLPPLPPSCIPLRLPFHSCHTLSFTYHLNSTKWNIRMGYCGCHSCCCICSSHWILLLVPRCCHLDLLLP
jgi:hypothetical protein